MMHIPLLASAGMPAMSGAWSPLGLSELVAWYRKDVGLDNQDGPVGQWNDQSGNDYHLTQATATRKPRWVPFGAEYYLYNIDSTTAAHTPSQDVDGDLDIRMEMKWDAFPPDALAIPLQKSVAATIDLDILIGTAGTFYLRWWDDGGTQRQLNSTANISGYVDGDRFWIRATLDVDNGAGQCDVTFYTSADGDTWDQLGDVVTGAFGTTTIRHSTPGGTIFVGSGYAGASSAFAKVYNFQLYLNAVLTLDMNVPRDFEEVYPLVSSTTGEEYDNSGGVPLMVEGSFLYFDGSNDGIQNTSISAAQPFTVYLRGALVNWIASRIFWSGNTIDTVFAQCAGTQRQESLNAGVYLNSGADFDLSIKQGTQRRTDTFAWCLNGTNSFLEFNGNRVTGNAGTNNMDAFTLGAAYGFTLPNNIQAKEVIIARNVSEAEHQKVLNYLNAIA